MSDKKGGGQVKETADERAQAETGLQLHADWEQIWKPLENKFIRATKDTTPERTRALGIANVENQKSFGTARDNAEAGLSRAGARPGSGRFNLAETGMGVDQGIANGMGRASVNNAVDDQYVTGLQALQAMGRGQQDDAVRGINRLASASGAQAEADALNSLQQRRGLEGAAGTAIGLAAGYGSDGAGTPNPGAGPQLDASQFSLAKPKILSAPRIFQ